MPVSIAIKTFHWSNTPGNVQLHFTLEGEESLRAQQIIMDEMPTWIPTWQIMT